MLKRILVLILISIFLSGCSRDKREIITFSSWGSVTEVAIIKNIINEFERKNPDIKVRFIHIPQNYFQKVHLLFASNTSPDVIFVNNLYLPVYKNKLKNLNNLIDKNELFKQSVDALSIDKQLFAIPRDVSNLVIYYNKNYITYEPRTFADFDKQIKRNYGKNTFGISYERDIFYAEPYILTLGYDNGIKYYLGLEGKYAPKPYDAGSLTQAQMFLNENLAFYTSGRWMYPKIKETAKFEYGIMAFPGKTYADASGWAISKNTKHINSAQKFVKYLSSKECIDYFTSTGLIVPARKDSAAIFKGKDKVFLDAIKNSEPRPIDYNYNKNRDKINKELFN
ncbi:extracellular solute-binding protein [bacterium]|nr:extracellular solute-binding protein [bacterium]